MFNQTSGRVLGLFVGRCDRNVRVLDLFREVARRHKHRHDIYVRNVRSMFKMFDQCSECSINRIHISENVARVAFDAVKNKALETVHRPGAGDPRRSLPDPWHSYIRVLSNRVPRLTTYSPGTFSGSSVASTPPRLIGSSPRDTTLATSAKMSKRRLGHLLLGRGSIDARKARLCRRRSKYPSASTGLRWATSAERIGGRTAETNVLPMGRCHRRPNCLTAASAARTGLDCCRQSKGFGPAPQNGRFVTLVSFCGVTISIPEKSLASRNAEMPRWSRILV